jgi:hypothetical protein
MLIFNIALEMANKIDASHSKFLDVIPSVPYIVNLLLSHVIGNYLATAFKFIWGVPCMICRQRLSWEMACLISVQLLSALML